MRMAQALLIATGVGGIALLLTLLLIFLGYVSTRVHILSGLATGFWNMFFQSMILFMWISYPKQILRQLNSRHSIKETDRILLRTWRKKLVILSVLLTLAFMGQMILGMASFFTPLAHEVHLYFAFILFLFFIYVYWNEIRGFNQLYQIVLNVFKAPRPKARE